jgi:hypothetical protein
MRNTYKHATYPHFFSDVLRAAHESHNGPSSYAIDHLNVTPTDTLTPPCTKRLEDRLFRSPPTGKMLHRHPTTSTVFNLLRCVDALHKKFSVPLNHFTYP